MSADRCESCVRQSDFSPKRLLATEFCSPWWIEASHVRRRDGFGRILVCRKRGAYPVGSMVACLVCRRTAPRDGSRQVCVDCCVETAVERFQQRLNRLPTDDRVEYFKLSWRRPVRVADWIKEGMKEPESAIEQDLGIPASDSDDDSSIDESDLFDGSLEADLKWGHAPSHHEILAQLRRRFVEPCVTKEGERRHRVKCRGAGCCKIMLAEGEDALINEIGYYHAKGTIVPSARRVNNPVDRRERPLPMPGQPCHL